MGKPISVQFKFLRDLSVLTDPTEPRMNIVQTVQIPAQHQNKLSRQARRYRVPEFLPLFALLCALALCRCFFLLIFLYQ